MTPTRILIAATAALVLAASCSSGPADGTSAADSAATATTTTVSTPARSTSPPPPKELPSAPDPKVETRWTVTEVTDGDTIIVVRGSLEEKLRLIGINAPETGECIADEATRALEELLLDREVSLVADQSDRDRYGRLLRYVWVDDVFVNAALVESGLALARDYPPDTAMVDVLAAAETTARDAGIGLWASDACGPAAPSDVRIMHIEADAPGNDNENPNGEWVEVRNTGTEPADLTGWVLKDESASHRYRFPDRFRIDPGAAVLVRTGCGNDTSDELFWCVHGSAVWNNSGDTAFLLDPSGNTIHHRSY